MAQSSPDSGNGLGCWRLRVLMSAYACEPNRGSEPGVGWNWALQAAKDHEVWVLTRRSNREPIERELSTHPVSGLHFIYYDLPGLIRWLKRRLPYGTQLYYLAWQIAAWRIAAAAHDRIAFDLSHHVTFVSCLFPSFLSRLRVPLVWGPVAGADASPLRFAARSGLAAFTEEVLHRIALQVGARSTLTAKTARDAKVVVAATPRTDLFLRNLAPNSLHATIAAIGIDGLGPDTDNRDDIDGDDLDRPLRVLFVGRLVWWKGLDLGLLAARTVIDQGVRLRWDIVGSGPDRGRLEGLVESLGLKDTIRFVGAVPLDVSRRYQADAFLFPSLRDSGGMAVIEAMARGLPVVCLDTGGPALSVCAECGVRIPVVSPSQVVTDLARAIELFAANPPLRGRMGAAARRHVENSYLWTAKRPAIRELYAAALERGCHQRNSRE